MGKGSAVLLAISKVQQKKKIIVVIIINQEFVLQDQTLLKAEQHQCTCRIQKESQGSGCER